jgi:hypothetical protein
MFLQMYYHRITANIMYQVPWVYKMEKRLTNGRRSRISTEVVPLNESLLGSGLQF